MDTITATQPELAALQDSDFWITIKQYGDEDEEEVLVTLAATDAGDRAKLREVWFDGVREEFANTGWVPRLLDGTGTRCLMPIALACRSLARFLVSPEPRRVETCGYLGTKVDLGPLDWDELCHAVRRLEILHNAAGAERGQAREQGTSPVQATVILRAGLDGSPAIVGIEHRSEGISSPLAHMVARELAIRLPERSLDGANVREVLEDEDTRVGARIVWLDHESVAYAIDDWRDDPDVSQALATGRVALDWRLGGQDEVELDDDEVGTRYRPKRPCGDLLTVAQLVDAIPSADPTWW